MIHVTLTFKNNSPATEAGLQEGDVITKVNGHKVTFYRDFISTGLIIR